MRRKLFLKIVIGISTYDADPLPDHFNFFRVRPDATGRMSLSVIMKCTAVIRQLAYGTTPDAFDEYLQMTHGFSGMLGSIDRMHWEGKNCPVSWQGQYALVLPYVVNGVGYEKGYYLADDIYPQWATFVKSFTVANDTKHAYFKKRLDSARKDVEHAFGVLQGRWGIIQQPARSYHVNTLRRVMYSCIILHNMILKDQKMAVFDWNEVYANPARNMQRTCIERCETQRRENKET
nr:nucleotide-binding, alpha-beta plait [Tanacetum cinerariifolium]GEV77867.1 nucleotide-binding, alpha-beta plait [Tanacetum cinerariifolium]